MTHMGQEFTLGAIRLRFLNRPLQTFLLFLLLRYDVFDVTQLLNTVPICLSI